MCNNKDDEKIVAWMQDGANLAKETGCSAEFMSWLIKSAIEISGGEYADKEDTDLEDEYALTALKSVFMLNKYLENECEYSNHSVWVDEKGYYFETDMGYFWSGLENLESCLIKRLRKAKIDRDWEK